MKATVIVHPKADEIYVKRCDAELCHPDPMRLLTLCTLLGKGYKLSPALSSENIAVIVLDSKEVFALRLSEISRILIDDGTFEDLRDQLKKAPKAVGYKLLLNGGKRFKYN